MAKTHKWLHPLRKTMSNVLKKVALNGFRSATNVACDVESCMGFHKNNIFQKVVMCD